MKLLRLVFLLWNDLAYRIIRPLIFRQSPQVAHEKLLTVLKIADSSPFLITLARIVHRIAFKQTSMMIGKVQLSHPSILAAGFVKGHGFSNEADACAAVDQGTNIIPGWKSAPALLGHVEFGSFTRHPRQGNAGVVLWRDPKTQSTQNRIGLKNPGATAAARFLAKHRTELPVQYGINIAVSPGIDDLDQEERDIVESLTIFLDNGIQPAWFTLNLSCPNTEDDPSGNQTEQKTARLCQAAVRTIQKHGSTAALWVKISPDLSIQQYQILMDVFAESGVNAVIATNTIGLPTPDKTAAAGVGGGRLHPHTLLAVRALVNARQHQQRKVDIVACGGILDTKSWLDFKALGITAFQYWSALVYRGPLAPAIIESEGL